MNTDLHQLQARLDAIEQKHEQEIATLCARHRQAEQKYQRATRHLKLQAGLAFLVVIAAVLIFPANRSAQAQATGNTLDARVQKLETKTQFMTTNTQTHSTVFSACNVFIQNGLGATNGLPGDPLNTDPAKTHTNGLGNLIVGYNESRALWGDRDTRTGSHNLIVGQLQDYSSFGGLLAGACNTISGAYASASGGDTNTASGDFASICSGEDNFARGGAASVSGGRENQANGLYASVSGGAYNAASGGDSSIVGGALNAASGTADCISGGQSNRASNIGSSISGGVGVTQATALGWSAGKLHTP